MATRKNPRKAQSAQKKKITVLSYMARQIDLMKLEKRFGTSRNYSKAQNSLNAFLKGRDICFSRIDESFVHEYNSFLEQRGITRNTISFYMRILRALYNKATKEHIARPRQLFSDVYTGVDKTRKRALDEKAVKRIMALDLKGLPSLMLSRDIFYFSFCMRGMSFVDIAFLKKHDYDGEYITYHRQKTGQRLMVYAEPCIERIIRRYSSQTAGTPYIFPIIKSDNSETAFRQYQTALGYHNRKLKELARRAKVNIPLSSYCARHTWATVARNHHIPISVIAAAMGHNSEKTTLIYLASLENSVIDKANRRVIESVGKTVSP